ncbi:MAG TPA: hypothetical protein VJT78_00135 [Candidatus Dormibacteraeota bacterium]|nr:hypothetical protein [Candidatus Dormibacteraeota bacterium]
MITPIGKFDPRRLFVRRMVIRIIVIVAMTTTAAMILLAVFADQADLIARAAIVVGGALIALTLTNGLASQLDVEGEAAGGRSREKKADTNWPSELLEIEGRVSLSKVSLFDHQSRLRPLFRELAAARLAANRNIDLASRPDEARQVLGAELWNEVQPLPAAGDLRELPGPTSAAIRRMVETLETI